jgi:hypothetical protein
MNQRLGRQMSTTKYRQQNVDKKMSINKKCQQVKCQQVKCQQVKCQQVKCRHIKMSTGKMPTYKKMSKILS